MSDLRDQVAAQCKAVAHMATALAQVNADYAKLIAEGHMDNLINQVGRRSAAVMEALGEMLNNIDAVTDEDAWMEPIFTEAHRLWPTSDSAA